MTKEDSIKFQGEMPYPPVNKVDDWGLDVEQQEAAVEQFRQHLEAKGMWRRQDHDYYTLLRFLRARNYELEKASKMWSDSLAFRAEYDVDTILDDFAFHEREQFLMAYPQGYHKTDKLGRPIYIQLLGKIDINTLKQITSEDRMIKFHIQEYERCIKHIMPVCSALAGQQVDQTFGIMDVKGVGLSHLTGEVKRLMGTLTKFDQDNYPEMLGRICIINAPMVFKAVWSLVKPMLNPRTLSKIQVCQSNYSVDLLKWVEPENLPEWLGGKSKGTLLDDIGPWSEPEVLRRLAAGGSGSAGSAAVAKAVRSIQTCSSVRLPGMLSGPLPSLSASGVAGKGAPGSICAEDSFQSPRSEASFVSISSAGGDTIFARTPTKRHGVSDDRDVADLADALSALPAGGVAPGANGSAPLLAAFTPDGPGSAGRGLLDRVTALEALYAQQVQRLRGYMPSTAVARLAEARSAPEGTLLQRLETLEEGMELLLRAQELSWRDEERTASRCCSGCTIC